MPCTGDNLYWFGMALPKHPVIGLTGGIGCGKTAAAQFFSRLGARVIDTDDISHTLSRPPSLALVQIAAHFGTDYLTPAGDLDRAKMRTLVFSDAQALQELEAIFHPLILQECRKQIDTTTPAPYTILVVPLLFEKNNFQNMINRSAVIDCNEEQQVARVMTRSGLSREEVHAIMSSQISPSERIKLADYVISNDGTLEQLSNQITQLHQTFLNLAGSMQ